MNAGVQEDLVAIRVVKAFVREDYEEEKYRAQTEEVRKSQLKAEKLPKAELPPKISKPN